MSSNKLIVYFLQITKATSSFFCSIELAGNLTRGMMTIDHKGLAGHSDNVLAVTEIDLQEFAKTLIWGMGGPNFN
jgi:inosine-uridine nucleoside N-ribohydrolase